MNIQLTSKEQNLLKDQLKHESICIQKYSNYSQQAADPELKTLFADLASQEQQHYTTIETMLNGQQPPMGQSKGQASSGQQATQMNYEQANLDPMAAQADAVLCTDMLMTEKFVSSSYDTGVFESTTPPVRQALQHIQKEEQNHGNKIMSYMQNKGLK